jgi:hypothetical protein
MSNVLLLLMPDSGITGSGILTRFNIAFHCMVLQSIWFFRFLGIAYPPQPTAPRQLFNEEHWKIKEQKFRLEIGWIPHFKTLHQKSLSGWDSPTNNHQTFTCDGSWHKMTILHQLTQITLGQIVIICANKPFQSVGVHLNNYFNLWGLNYQFYG